MSLLSPRRSQYAYLPYKRDSLPIRAFTSFERFLKGLLFGCRMCGNCVLQETAFICPMTCAKGLRNGLCGGSTPDKCYVDPSKPCTWYKIFERAERMGRLDTLLEVLPPVDGSQAGHETWLDLVRRFRHREEPISPRELVFNPEKRAQFFYYVRQPDWWQGDALYHPPAYEEPVSMLERHLRAGIFTVTSEIAPPLSTNTNGMIRKAHLLKDWVVAANFTDNASASPRMSSLASAKLTLDMGFEPVMQMQTRDRDRYALESEAMGAAGLGIRNILCLSGDHLRLGPGPTPRPVQNDLDAVQLVWMLRRMRDEARYLDGRSLKTPPKFFLGAAASPYAAVPRYEALRTEKKINAGAQFIQTQPIFDYDRFVDWMEAIDKRNLVDKAFIMPGVIPLKSAGAAHFMADDVPGVVVPSELVKRMDDAADQQEEGVAIALELIEKIKNTPGVKGMHIMAVHWEAIVPRLVEESNLPRPVQELLQAQTSVVE